MHSLTHAWTTLLILSAISTALSVAVTQGALSGQAITLGGALILALAWWKARVILARYLGLAQAPFWRRGFDTVLALYAALLLVLYLAA